MAQFTKMAIVNSFVELLNEQPFDKITVTDIVNKCGVNRNTFYYYYQDMYALVDEMFRTETNRIIDEHREFITWQDGFLEATRFARENKTAIYHLYNSINRDKLEEYLYDITYDSVNSYVRRQAEGLKVRDEDIHDLAVLYSVALEGIAMEWMHGGMKQDPEAYIKNMGRLLDGTTRFTLERAAGQHQNQ